MFEKNLNIAYLLDFYGDLLSERKRSVMNMYYNEDLSLAEVASEVGISRQGVRDLIKKSEEELFEYEEKLGLAQKISSLEQSVQRLRTLASEHSLPDALKSEINVISEIIDS